MLGCVFGEFSQTITREFRKRGHEFYSCDILPTEGNPEWHIQADWREVIPSRIWDFGIIHPVCTEVAVSGNPTYAFGKRGWPERQRKMVETPALWEFFKRYVVRGALEQPVNVLPKKAMGECQIIQPWFFGVEAFKATCLYLHNVPPLMDTNRLMPPASGTSEHARWSKVHRAPPSPDRWKDRSRTEPAIAEAMARQWGAQ